MSMDHRILSFKDRKYSMRSTLQTILSMMVNCRYYGEILRWTQIRRGIIDKMRKCPCTTDHKLVLFIEADAMVLVTYNGCCILQTRATNIRIV